MAKWKTVSNHEGKNICKPFQDARGCKKGRACNFLYICDAIVNGKVCAKTHPRKDHNEDKDGKVQPR